MNVTVLLFATLKDRAGTNRLPLTLPDSAATLADVRAALLIAQPALTDSLGSAVGSINQEFAFAADPIHEGDEIAFFPPVSGGAQAWTEIYRVTPDVIDLNELTRAISTPATGAVCLFNGSVRGETNANPAVAPVTAQDRWCKGSRSFSGSASCPLAIRRCSLRARPATAIRGVSRPPVMGSIGSKRSCRSGKKRSARMVRSGWKAAINRRRTIRAENFRD